MSEETVPLWKKIARFRIKAKKAALGTDRRALNEATDIIESQSAELSALRERVKEQEQWLNELGDIAMVYLPESHNDDDENQTDLRNLLNEIHRDSGLPTRREERC